MGPGEKKEGKEGPPDLKSVSLGVKGTCGSSAGSPPYRGDHQPPLAGGRPCCSCWCRSHSQMHGAWSPPPWPSQGRLPCARYPADCLIQGLVGHEGAPSSCLLPEAQVTGLLGSIRWAWRAGSPQVKAGGPGPPGSTPRPAGQSSSNICLLELMHPSWVGGGGW